MSDTNRFKVVNNLKGRTTRPGEITSGAQIVLADGTVSIRIFYINNSPLSVSANDDGTSFTLKPGESKAYRVEDDPGWLQTNDDFHITYSINAPGNRNPVVPDTRLAVKSGADVHLDFKYTVDALNGAAFYQVDTSGTGYASQDRNTQILPAAQTAT